jgi:hypothetical protein
MCQSLMMPTVILQNNDVFEFPNKLLKRELMHRRKFLASSLAASASAAIAPAQALTGEEERNSGREYYLLRRYDLRSGPQVKLANQFFRDAFIPTANRLGITPVGVFNLVLGPQTPALYALLPSASLTLLANLDAHLESDPEYLRAGADFLNAPAASPSYVRMESSLMVAFKGRPRLQPPPMTAERQPRTFELRTYESPSERDHRRKIEMFHSGEFDIFRSAGFWPVFYGDTLVGSRMPNLTYMLAFSTLAERDKLWEAFGSSPEWKNLTHSPKFDFEAIVTNVTNVILSPASYSQI